MKLKNLRSISKSAGLALALVFGVSITSVAAMFGFGGDRWSEEVLLHDGRKMIVERSQSYGGRGEVGQPAPIKEHSISFALPGSRKPFKWTSEYSDDIGRTNFNLLAVHVKEETPYLVASPNLCLSYNKWGRPNPPYVFFKHDGSAWQRISLEQFPSEFKTINVAQTLNSFDIAQMIKRSPVSASEILERNRRLRQPEYRSILREALPSAGGDGCSVMIPNGKGGWLGIDWFRDQPNSDACLKVCTQKGLGPEFCPCKNLFEKK
ncbi:hypothetical protein [Polaromonas sp. YR568]|uniref:hypothetical protein n=1 Tax=Polaromonas sp. YR568 TaxID=1855301 RepID=UPI00313778DA